MFVQENSSKYKVMVNHAETQSFIRFQQLLRKPAVALPYFKEYFAPV